MQDVGHLNQFPELNAIVWTIFRRQYLPVQLPDGNIIKAKCFSGKDLWYVDYEGSRYVEQNPKTGSSYAKKAQAGAKIVWVIRKGDGYYLGCVEGNRVFMKPK